MEEVLNYFSYNSVVILTYFFISLGAFILNTISKGKANKLLFSTYRSSLFNPLTYVRLFTHCLGHENWNHFMNNFLTILLVGPMLEEKYGSIPILQAILITASITGIFNSIFFKNVSLKGASGTVYMFILLSSFVNISQGKIPITLILIFLFYIVSEIRDGLFKKDNISHMGHLIGAISGCIFGYFVF